MNKNKWIDKDNELLTPTERGYLKFILKPSLFSNDVSIAFKKITDKMNEFSNKKEDRKESMALIIVEFDKGNIITKCSNCGQDVNIIDKFCKNCGCQFMEAIECEWRKNNL